MTTQQPEAMRLTEIARYCFRSEGMSDPPEQFESTTGDMVDYFDHVEIEKALLDRITELESQLAQRFDAADMATAAAQEDVARLDFLIEQRAYVVSDPDACPGHWLHWAMPDGRTWVQGDEHPTPRAAIDSARKQGARWQSAVRALTLHI